MTDKIGVIDPNSVKLYIAIMMKVKCNLDNINCYLWWSCNVFHTCVNILARLNMPEKINDVNLSR